MMASRWPLVAVSLLPTLAWAQTSGWIENEANTTMCTWNLPRVGVIRDTLYIDGGELYWQPLLKSGPPSTPIKDTLDKGVIHTLNFSTPFKTSGNFSEALSTIAPLTGPSNNLAPDYTDGVLLANNFEFLTYGGLLLGLVLDSEPDADASLAYEQYNSVKDRKFSPGFSEKTLTPPVNRYVGYGAGVSVPSENMGYYFGGLKAKGGGPVYQVSGNKTTDPTTYSRNLVTLDMSTQQEEVWKNEPLGKTVPNRASPEMVWVPVGEKGVLVVIGGVVDPIFTNVNTTLDPTSKANSQANSPAFLSVVSVYDIATKAWFQQLTTGAPPSTAWTQGCAVVASTLDGETHNIYYYGGFDGINLNQPFNDEVWVLSLPTFTWVKVAEGRAGNHGRAGHRCVMPYPDQMIVVGGKPSSGGDEFNCVEGSIVQLFNLTSLNWYDSYDPRVWNNYTVPPIVAAAAEASTTRYVNASLGTIVKTKYDATKIKNWYPYEYTANVTHPDEPANPTTTAVAPGGSGTPKWLAPVLGVVLTLVVLSALAIAFLLWRRRRYLRRRDSVAATSEVNRNRILSWVWGHDAKSGGGGTVTSEESPSTAFDDDTNAGSGVGGRPGSSGRHLSTGTVPSVNVVEAGGDMVHELPDTSRIQELSAAGLVDVPVGGGLKASPSVASTASRTSELSADERASGSSVGRQSPGGLGKGELDGGAGAGERRRSGPVTPRAERFGSVGSVSDGEMSATGGLSPDEGAGSGAGKRRTSAFGEMLDDGK
ncbi:hypothetical protein O988_04896 [Pseudogymnoascus sp. VKM F-3808]|nr:hypothetical protein O988_04896 [Pseudogymnoascus sp. VKM F-3808]